MMPPRRDATLDSVRKADPGMSLARRAIYRDRDYPAYSAAGP